MIREDSHQIFYDDGIKTEFMYETHYEEDKVWGCLCVRIDNDVWRMCQPLYGTEDINKIRELISNRTR